MRLLLLLIATAMILFSVTRIKKPIVVLNDNELYAQIADPLLETIVEQGTPISGVNDSTRQVQYAFYDSVKQQTYLIVIAQHPQPRDTQTYSNGVIKGTLVSPWSKEQRSISLSEFVTRMIFSHGTKRFIDHDPTGEVCWKTKGYFWCIDTEPDDDGFVCLDIERRDARNHWPVKLKKLD